LLHTPGKGTHSIIKARGHAYHSYYFVNPFFGAGHIIHTAVEFKVLIGCKITVKESLVTNYANPTLELLGTTFRTQAIKENSA
jgi:hypothetical protein